MIQIGCQFGLQRDELTRRFARTVQQTSSYPQERKLDPGSETSVHLSHPKKMKNLGSPMRNAPFGVEAELQRVLLKKAQPRTFEAIPLIGMILFEFVRAPFRRRREAPETESTQTAS